MIHILRTQVASEQIVEMLREYEDQNRPKLGNRNIVIGNEKLRKGVESLTREILGGA